MSRPKDAALTVMDYFRAAPLDAARLVLRFATQEMRRREQAERAPKKAPATAKAASGKPATAKARPSRAKRPADVPLPGIQESVGN